MRKRLYLFVGLLLFATSFVKAFASNVLATGGIHQYAEQSALSKDKWVRVSVSHTGVYQLTDTDLRRMGFSNPAQVGIYGFGGNMLSESFAKPHIDDIHELGVWRDEAKKRTLFYARGPISWEAKDGKFKHRTNPYSTKGYYFLKQKTEAPKAMTGQSSGQNSDKTITSFDSYALHEVDEVNLGATGRMMYGESFLYTPSQQFSLTTPGIKEIEQEAKLDLSFVTNATSAGAKLSVTISDDVINKTASFSQDSYLLGAEINIAHDFVPASENSTSVRVRFDKNGALVKTARLDYIRVNYQQKLKNTDFFVGFRSLESEQNTLMYKFDIQGKPKNLQVWDVTSADNHKSQELIEDEGKMAFVASETGLKEYVLVNTSSIFPDADFVGKVDNQNLHALPQTDMVIIVQPELRQQAERLADYRRKHDSLHVTLVSPQEIYNEFSSATPDATAYRLFMKMFYDRSATQGKAPRYLLLFGDGANDNRGMNSALWTKAMLKNSLLTYQSEYSLNETESYVCDDYFGFLDDNEGGKLDSRGLLTINSDVLDIGIGRLPVRDEKEARQVVDKVIKYSDNEVWGNWKNQLCFMGDDGDHNVHMDHAEDMVSLLKKEGQNGFNIKKIYFDSYKLENSSLGYTYPDVRKELLHQLQQGALLLNYSGHGSTTSIAHERVFLMSDAVNLSMRRLPIWVTATCDFSRYDHPTTSIGEELLLNPKGGGVALFTTSRVVYTDGSKRINTNLLKVLFSKNPDGTRLRLGDVLKESKKAYGIDYSKPNKLNYSLLGDPSMMMSYPGHNVRITHINGKEVSQEPVLIKALSEVTFRGEILKVGSEEVDTNFDGIVFPTVFDSEEEITTLDNKDTGESFVFKDRNRRLFVGNDSVSKGVFEFSFIMPKDISYSNDYGMLNIYAHDDNGSEAQGYFDNFKIGGTADEVMTDTIGPRITGIYLNNDSFKSGMAVNSTPFLIAYLEDESGINTSGAAIGHDLTATITKNGNTVARYVLNTYFQTDAGNSSNGVVRFSIPELANGKYELHLKAWDLFNNSSQKTVSFEIKSSIKPQIYDLRAKVNPVRDHAEFLLTHNRPESNMSMTIQVYTQMGQLVWEEKLNGSSEYMTDLPITWDLRSFSQTRVAPGIYIYRASISSDGEHYATKSKKLIVLEQ